MTDFIQKYEVQKGRTVTCKMGTAHEGEKGITLLSFSGFDDKVKQAKIDELVKLGSLKPVPLADSEKQSTEEIDDAKKANEDDRTAEIETDSVTEYEKAILSANFDKMNKQPLIDFAEEWEIHLKETTAVNIRAELNLLKESL